MSSENPAAISAISPSGSSPTVTSPRQPISASLRARAGKLGGARRESRRPVRSRRRGRATPASEAQTVGGDPGQEPALAGRLDAVATEPFEHLGVRTHPGQPGLRHRGGQPCIAGQGRRDGEDGGDAAAGRGLDDAVHGQVGLAAGAGPSRTASSARRTCRAVRSASE